MSENLARAKTRLIVMLALDMLALVAAAGFAVGYFVKGVGWMLPAFIAALAVGFAGQIWFIVGLGRANKGA